MLTTSLQVARNMLDAVAGSAQKRFRGKGPLPPERPSATHPPTIRLRSQESTESTKRAVTDWTYSMARNSERREREARVSDTTAGRKRQGTDLHEPPRLYDGRPNECRHKVETEVAPDDDRLQGALSGSGCDPGR